MILCMFLSSQLLSFLQGLFTFYHEGYELAQEFAPYKQQLQFNLQNVRMHLLSPSFHSNDLRVTQLEPSQTLSKYGQLQVHIIDVIIINFLLMN